MYLTLWCTIRRLSTTNTEVHHWETILNQ
jgi:hypothetical protein